MDIRVMGRGLSLGYFYHSEKITWDKPAHLYVWFFLRFSHIINPSNDAK